ncbi:MAG: putative hydrolase [Myxococcaceae bacterium]|nr:putative hydrolase [Myxococcaceae bacterium]
MTLTTHAAQPSSQRRLQDVPLRMIDIGGASVAYRCLGSGPDLVFLHGWPLDSNTYRQTAPRLAQHFRCHLFDLPGAGSTQTRDPSLLQLSAHARTVRAVVDALGLTRYALLAHDSGGFVARAVAADDPRVAALVLGNTELPGTVASVIHVLQWAIRLPGGAALLTNAMRLRFVRRSPLGFGGCFADLQKLDGAFHDLFVAPLLQSKEHAHEVLELLRTLDTKLFDQLPAMHARIQAPTLLIWGGADPIFPLALARQMLPQFGGGAQLEVIEGKKCFVHEEEPERFADFAHAFLLRRFASASAAE